MQELGPNQEKGLAALESGEYEQGKAFLCNDGKYCCLGVFAELFATEKFDYSKYGAKRYSWEVDERERSSHNTAPPSVIEAMSLRDDGGGHISGSTKESLWWLNDCSLSFKEIAALIRSNPGNYFKEPK